MECCDCGKPATKVAEFEGDIVQFFCKDCYRQMLEDQESEDEDRI